MREKNGSVWLSLLSIVFLLHVPYQSSPQANLCQGETLTLIKLTGVKAPPLTEEEQLKAICEIPRDREVIELFKKMTSTDRLPQR